MENPDLIKPGERVDDLELSDLVILQNPDKFCFGMDAVLLSGFATTRKGDKVLDLGTGTGILPILMSAKTEASHFTGLEIQDDIADMAKRSVLLNGLSDRIEIVNGDLKRAASIFEAASFDVVTCNPPYMVDDHGIKNPDSALAIARHEIAATLMDVCVAAAKMVRPGGSFYMVHRPFRLAEIIRCLSECNLEPKRMRLVHPYIDKEPNMVMIQAVRGGKPRMIVEPPLVVYESKGIYSKEMQETYGY